MKKSKLLLVPILIVLLAGIVPAQSGSTGSPAAGSTSGSSTNTGGSPPGATPGTTGATSPANTVATDSTITGPQPFLVTPTVENGLSGLNELNQNFNNIPDLNNQSGNTPGNTGLNTTTSNTTGLTSTVDQFGNQVFIDQFGNRMDQFGNPMLATGTILIDGIPVTVNNPFANPFNTGIILDQSITGTNFDSQNFNQALTNPNLPLNVSSLTTNAQLTNTNSGVVDASDSSLTTGVQFPAITVVGGAEAASEGFQTPNPRVSSVSSQSTRTSVRGITRRMDGTFTNVDR